MATTEVNLNGRLYVDKVLGYKKCRYVSAPYATWRLLGFELTGKMHTIEILPVYLPEEQSIVYRPGIEEAALARGQNTKLTAFFEHYHNLQETVASLKETVEEALK